MSTYTFKLPFLNMISSTLLNVSHLKCIHQVGHIKIQWLNISNMSTYNGCNILSRNAKNITFLSKPFQNGIRYNAKFTVCSCFQCTEKIILIFIKRLNVKLRVNDSLKICLCFSLLTMSRSRWAHTVLCFHASNTAIILLL